MTELTIKEIEKVIDRGFEKQAVLINKAFQVNTDHFDKRFKGIDERFDKLETKVDVIQGKLDNILYKEVVQIESRVKKIEQHLGFKTS